MSKIPVFVSCPTLLNDEQKNYNEFVNSLLSDFGLERRALGLSDYPVENPLKEIYVLAKHCAGGLILGFEQSWVEKGIIKRGTDKEKHISEPYSLPTPWNDIEAGILFALRLPILIFKEQGVKGGIFDLGSSEYFINELPRDISSEDAKQIIKQVFSKWAGKVIETYHSW